MNAVSNPVSPVVDADPILDGYQQLRDRLQVMREHADSGRWEELIECEGEYVCAIEALGRLEKNTRVAPENQEPRHVLLVEICAIEDEVRLRLQARLTELGVLMGLSRNRARVQRSYERAALG